MFDAVGNFAFLVVIFFFSRTSVSIESPYWVVIGVSENDSRDFDVLASSIRTQLSDFGAVVRVQHSLTIGQTLDKPAMAATAVLKEAPSEILVLIKGDSMEIKIDDGKSARLLTTRPFPAATRWEDTCDASASIIRSIFESWLADAMPESSSMKIEVASTEPKPTVESRAPSREESPAGLTSTLGNADKLSWSVAVDTGYVLQVVSERYSILNGGRFGLKVRITRFTRFDVGVDFLQRMNWEMNGWQFAFTRWPVRSTLSGQWMYRRLTLGAGAALVVDFTRMKGSPPRPDELRRNFPPPDELPDNFPPPDELRASPAELAALRQFSDGGSHTFFGLGLGAYLSFRVLAWMDIEMLAGCDFFFNHQRYLLNDGSLVFNYRLAQPRFLVGLTFWLVSSHPRSG